MRHANRPVWLRVGVGLWPYGLEMLSNGISLKLRDRWQEVGWLWLEGEGFHQALMSEPIMLKLNEARLRGSK